MPTYGFCNDCGHVTELFGNDECEDCRKRRMPANTMGAGIAVIALLVMFVIGFAFGFIVGKVG